MGRKGRMRIALPPHVNAVRARGKEYFYYHPHRGTAGAGKSVPLPGAPMQPNGTPNQDWWTAYRQLAGDTDVRPVRGSFAALIDVYQASPEWTALSPRTRSEWTRHFKYLRSAWGELVVAGVEPRHVVALRDTRASTPADANNLVRATSALITWGVLRGWRPDNPCKVVPRFKLGEGYAPWAWDSIEHFRQHARPDLWHAAALALYSGQRLSDVLGMKWSDIADGLIAVIQSKTGKQLWLPVHSRLRVVLGAMPRQSVFILTNTTGKPWTANGFKASWGNELNRPIMSMLRDQRCVFHGLRKSAVVTLLEAGATDAEVAAVTGQSREMVAHYSRQVNQRKLAAAAILKWEAADDEAGQVSG